MVGRSDCPSRARSFDQGARGLSIQRLVRDGRLPNVRSSTPRRSRIPRDEIRRHRCAVCGYSLGRQLPMVLQDDLLIPTIDRTRHQYVWVQVETWDDEQGLHVTVRVVCPDCRRDENIGIEAYTEAARREGDILV